MDGKREAASMHQLLVPLQVTTHKSIPLKSQDFPHPCQKCQEITKLVKYKLQ